MSDEWKYRDLPRANGQVAPSYWNKEEKEFEVYEGNVGVVEELASIKQTQNEILKRLDKPIDTQVTGSIVVEKIIDNEVIAPSSKITWGSTDLRDYKDFKLLVASTEDGNMSGYIYAGGSRPSMPIEFTDFKKTSAGRPMPVIIDEEYKMFGWYRFDFNNRGVNDTTIDVWIAKEEW